MLAFIVKFSLVFIDLKNSLYLSSQEIILALLSHVYFLMSVSGQVSNRTTPWYGINNCATLADTKRYSFGACWGRRNPVLFCWNKSWGGGDLRFKGNISIYPCSCSAVSAQLTGSCLCLCGEVPVQQFLRPFSCDCCEVLTFLLEEACHLFLSLSSI